MFLVEIKALARNDVVRVGADRPLVRLIECGPSAGQIVRFRDRPEVVTLADGVSAVRTGGIASRTGGARGVAAGIVTADTRTVLRLTATVPARRSP